MTRRARLFVATFTAFAGLAGAGLAAARRTAAGSGGSAGAAQSPQSVSDSYNYAPGSRTVTPKSISGMSGSIVNQDNVLTGNATAIVGKGAYLVLDFGKEVGGIITLTFAAASDANQRAENQDQRATLGFERRRLQGQPDQHALPGRRQFARGVAGRRERRESVEEHQLRAERKLERHWRTLPGVHFRHRHAFGDPLPNVQKRCEYRNAP